MHSKKILNSGVAVCAAVMSIGSSAWAANTIVQIGASGKTYASSTVQCDVSDPTLYPPVLAPAVEAGLFNQTSKISAAVSLNGAYLGTVTAGNPRTVLLNHNFDDQNPINNKVVVAISKKIADSYSFSVPESACNNLGNAEDSTGTLEYAAASYAAGNSYATVVPGCALNPATSQAQPYVKLFDKSGAVLNVSVNGVPLTQINGTTHPIATVYLGKGLNVISAAVATNVLPLPPLPIDYYVRDGGGNGTCTLP
jgi:hypothetical protein